jgi:TolB protein
MKKRRNLFSQFLPFVFSMLIGCVATDSSDDNIDQNIPIDGRGGGIIAFYSGNKSLKSVEIFIMNADGTGLKQLTDNAYEDGSPSLAPDGTKILFNSSPTNQTDIYVMNIDGTEIKQLTSTSENEEHPEWSPNGRKILYTRYPAESWHNGDIFVMDADGNNCVQLTDNPKDDMRPFFSPDMKTVIFNSNRDGNIEIYTMNTDGTNQKRLMNTKTPQWKIFPNFSPDGKKIVYTLTNTATRQADIHIINSDGTDDVVIISIVGRDEHPRWSPNGNRIVFQSERDGNFEIYVMNSDGSNQTRLTNNPGFDGWPTWSIYPVN